MSSSPSAILSRYTINSPGGAEESSCQSDEERNAFCSEERNAFCSEESVEECAAYLNQVSFCLFRSGSHF